MSSQKHLKANRRKSWPFLTIMLAGIIVSVGASLFGARSWTVDSITIMTMTTATTRAAAMNGGKHFLAQGHRTFVHGIRRRRSYRSVLWGNIFRSSFAGILVGAVMAAIMYGVMKMLYSQQSTSLVQTASLMRESGNGHN